MNDLKYKIETQIVNRSNGRPIPKDEPIFFLRARDYLALPLLYAYRKICEGDACNSYHLGGVNRVIRRFERFKKLHPEQMKQPGITKGR
jgi:hypothetical protein